MATLYESYTTNDGYIALSANTKRIGFTFTTTSRHTITSFISKMFRHANPGTITFKLYATSSGIPTGSALATGSTNADTLTTYVAGNEREITWDTEVTLANSTMYAIEATYSASAGNYFYLRMDLGGGYTGGSIISYDGGWATQPYDGYFKIYGNSAGQLINFSETFSLSETKRGDLNTTKQETINFVDSISAVKAAFINFVETIGISDFLNQIGAAIINLTETINLTEAKNISLNLIRQTAITLSDSVGTVRTTIISLIETITTSDLFSTSNIWTWLTKHSSSWTQPTKNTSNWTFKDKT